MSTITIDSHSNYHPLVILLTMLGIFEQLLISILQVTDGTARVLMVLLFTTIIVGAVALESCSYTVSPLLSTLTIISGIGVYVLVTTAAY